MQSAGSGPGRGATGGARGPLGGSEPDLRAWLREAGDVAGGLSHDLSETERRMELAQARSNPARGRVDRVMRIYSEGRLDQVQTDYDQLAANPATAPEALDNARERLFQTTRSIGEEPGFKSALRETRASIAAAEAEHGQLREHAEGTRHLYARTMSNGRRLNRLIKAGMDRCDGLPALDRDQEQDLPLADRAERLERVTRTVSDVARRDPELRSALGPDLRDPPAATSDTRRR